MRWHSRSVSGWEFGEHNGPPRLFPRATMTQMKQSLWKEHPKQVQKAERSEMVDAINPALASGRLARAGAKCSFSDWSGTAFLDPRLPPRIQELGYQPNGSLNNPASLMAVPAFCPPLLLRASPPRRSTLVPGCLPTSTLGFENLPPTRSVGILPRHSLLRRG